MPYREQCVSCFTKSDKIEQLTEENNLLRSEIKVLKESKAWFYTLMEIISKWWNTRIIKKKPKNKIWSEKVGDKILSFMLYDGEEYINVPDITYIYDWKKVSTGRTVSTRLKSLLNIEFSRLSKEEKDQRSAQQLINIIQHSRSRYENK